MGGVDGAFLVLIVGVLMAYLYAFVSGFTDAANAIATAVGTRALSPTQAVAIGAAFELLGALTGTAVALTIGRGIVDPTLLTPMAVIAAVAGAMLWSLLAYTRGIPVSETHGLIGAILGVALANAGAGAVIWTGLLPVLVAIIVSPALGALGGILAFSAVCHVFARLHRRTAVEWSVQLQRLSSAFMAFSHGRNDAQKPMGVLTLALITYSGTEVDDVPLWVILSVAAVASLGVAAGGWRIIRSLGMRITGLRPEQGFAAETAAGTVLQIASQAGIPVSTTQTIASSIVGVGLVTGWRSIRWGLVLEIMLSWALTLPVTILFGYAFASLLRSFGG
jgi:PiT family inorganic phosphate transporter